VSRKNARTSSTPRRIVDESGSREERVALAEDGADGEEAVEVIGRSEEVEESRKRTAMFIYL